MDNDNRFDQCYSPQGGFSRRGSPVALIAKGIASGISLASESLHTHNEKRAAKKGTKATEQHSGTHSAAQSQEYNYTQSSR